MQMQIIKYIDCSLKELILDYNKLLASIKETL